ncbi:Uncharacterized protein Dip518_000073 [Parelusimicrobium proximum]|uniref:sugar isomerase domain-containing protein n=1 Tax=Parelusimicrobium proximum TaxID=3228953 RepID=UPI003D163832
MAKHVYLAELVRLIEEVEKTQMASIDKAAEIVAQTLAKGGIIHTFGAGHSGSVAIEGFHRSGSFVEINAVLDPALMLQRGAIAGTAIERLEGYTPAVLATHDMRAEDCMILISNSGKNPAGIDAALYAKKIGMKVIVITAYEAQKDAASRHSSGKKLADTADVVIDNLATKDETTTKLSDGTIFGPTSTVTGAAIINAVYFNAAEILLKKGLKVHAYTSSNNKGDGGNEELSEKYAKRVKHIK